MKLAERIKAVILSGAERSRRTSNYSRAEAVGRMRATAPAAFAREKLEVLRLRSAPAFPRRNSAQDDSVFIFP